MIEFFRSFRDEFHPVLLLLLVLWLVVAMGGAVLDIMEALQ
jgi:hypothetical protein